MNDPIDVLYKFMQEKNILPANAPFERFKANMQDPANQRALYDKLAADNIAGGSWEDFSNAYFTPVAPDKKKVGTEPQPQPEFSAGPGNLLGAPSVPSETSSSSASAPAPSAGTNSAPNVFGLPAEEPAIAAEDFLPRDQTKPLTFDLNAPGAIPDKPRDTGKSKYVLNGSEDINAHMDEINSSLPHYEYRKEYEAKTVLRQANRDMRNIAEYGTMARNQIVTAGDDLAARFGKDWQTAAEAGDANIVNDPAYKLWAGGIDAQNKAYESYTKYADEHPEFAQKMLLAQTAQQRADASYKGGPEVLGTGTRAGGPLGTLRFVSPNGTTGNWLARKGAQLAGAVLSLPRTVSGALPDSWVDSDRFAFADELASWGDNLVEEANLRYPKPQQLKRPLYEHVVKFEGKKVSIDDAGKPIAVRDKDEENITVTPEFEARFKDSGAADRAKIQFNGGAISDQTLDAAADLIMYRYMGGGTKVGTVLSSFAMQHQQAYQEAIVNNKMSPQDAAEYAFYSALGNGVIEAYVGDVETAFAKPSIIKAAQVGKKEALELAGKVSPGAKALRALKPVVKEIGMENTEEVLQSLYSDGMRYGFNKMTGADMEIQTTPKSLAETALITTLVTAPAAGFGGHVNTYRQSALMAAVKDPERLSKVMGELVDGGVVDGNQASYIESRIERLAKFNENLPEKMDETTRGQVLALQEYRDAHDGVSSSENYTPAQRQAARQEVQKTDKIISSLIGETAAQKADEAPTETEKRIEQAEPAAIETPVAEAQEGEMPIVAENATVPTEIVSDTNVVRNLPVVTITPSESVPTRADQAQVDEAVAARPEAQPLVTGEFFSNPDMTVGDLAAAVQIPNEEPAGEQTDHAATIQTAVGDRITEAAVDMLQRKGYPQPDTKEVAAIQNFVLPEMVRPTMIDDPTEHPANALDRLTDEYMIEKGVEPKSPATTVEEHTQLTQAESTVESATQSLPAAQQRATDDLVASLGNNPDRIAGAIDGTGTPEDVESYKQFAASNPEAASQIQSAQNEIKRNAGGGSVENVVGSEPVNREDAQASVEVDSQGLIDDQKSIAGGGDVEADVPGRNGSVNPVSVEVQEETQHENSEALAEHELPEKTNVAVVSDMTAAGIIDADQAAIASLVEEGVEIPGGEAVHAEVSGKIGELRQGNTQERADTQEAQRFEDMKAATEPATVLEKPVFVETATEFIVTRSTDIRDVMREMGGKWQPGRGWVFPIGKKHQVMAAIQRPSNPTSDVLPKRGGIMDSRIGVAVRNTLVYRVASQRMRRIAKGKTLMDQINIAKEELRIANDERQRRTKLTAERIQKAFPGVEVITDPTEFKRAAKVFGENPPAAFTVDGKVYIDLERTGIDAPLHEFGHIWNTLAAVHFPEQHKAGLESVRGSEYEAAVREDARYTHLDEEGVLDEALALAIGERGARMMNASTWSRFRSFLTDLATSMKTLLGIDARNMTAAQYADWVAAKLLDGKALFDENADEIKRIEKQARAMFLGMSADWQAPARKEFVTAKTLEHKGFSNSEVWRMTNWRRGIDGRWKFEISDAGAVLTIEPRLMEEGEIRSLSDVMQHDALYELLPEMKDVPVLFYNDPESSDAASTTLIGDAVGITINTAYPEHARLSVLHEAQHIVQLYEGFGVGLGAKNVHQYMMANIEAAIKEAETKIGEEKSKVVLRMQRLIELLKERQSEIYRRAAGEVEARNVEARANMSEEEIRQSEPSSTEDVAPEEQVVLFNKEFTDLIESATLAPPGFQEEGENFKGFDGPARFQYGNADLRDAAIKSAIRQIVRIQIHRGLTDRTTAVPIIAQELGVYEAWVNQVWDEEGKNPHRFSLQDGSGTKSFGEKVQRWATRQFSYKGLLPKDIYREATDIQKRVAAIMYRGEKQAKDMEKTIVAATKGMSEAETRAFRRQVNDVMNGNADWGNLPPAVEASMMIVRGTINSLSQEILKSGMYNKAMVVTIMENMGVDVQGADPAFFNSAMAALEKPPYERTDEENKVVDDFISRHHTSFGTYLNRSYRVHNYPDWKERIPRDVWANAKRFFISELQRRYKELEDVVARNDDKDQGKLDELNAQRQEVVQLIDDFTKELPVGSVEADFAELVRDELAGVVGITAQGVKDMDALIGDDADALRGWFTQSRAIQAAIANREVKMQRRKDKAAAEMDNISGRLINIDDEIHEALDAQQAPEAILGGAIVGAKPLGIMKERKDIPEEIRMLFGEYRDPTVNVMQSMFKMANLLGAQDFLNNLRSRYEGVYFFKDGNKPAGNWAKIAAEGNHRIAPLDGWYTTEDIRDGLSDFYGKSNMADWQKVWLTQIVNYIKIGKTILSPVTQARNFWGNASFALANGWNPLRMFQAWNEYGAYWNGMDSKKWRQYAEKLHGLGVFGESANARDIEDLRNTLGMKDIPNETYEEFAQNRFLQVATAPARGFMKASKATFGAAQFTYELGDAFWKMMGFENEKRRYAKAYFGKLFSELSAEQQAEAEKRAADIIRAVLPTYSYVPKIVHFVRRFPLMGTFVAFPAEMIRVTYNSYALGIEELKDPRARAFGVMRLAGITTSLSLSAAVVQAAKALFGYDDEEWDDANYFVSQFQKNSMLVPLPRDKSGNMRYVNLSYTDPYSFLSKMITAGFDDPTTPPAGRAVAMLGQLTEPFLSPELTFNTFEQLRLNVDDRGEKIIKDAYEDPMFGTKWLAGENLTREFDFARKKLQPGISRSLWDAWDIYHVNSDNSGRVKEWSDFLLNHTFGLNVERIDPTVSYGFQMKALMNERNQSRAGYSAVQGRLNRSWESLQDKLVEMAPEERAARVKRFEDEAKAMLQNQYEVSKSAYLRILNDAHKVTSALMRLGVEEKEVRGILKDVKFGQRTGEIDAIISGNTSNLILSFKSKGKY